MKEGQNFKLLLFRPGLLYTLILASALLFVYGFYLRPAHIDDAWLGEYTYWFSKLGYVKSEFFRGYLGHENQLFVYHKLFLAQGALVTRLFGFNLYTLKSISILYLLGSIWAYYKVSQQQGTSKAVLIFSLCLLSVNSYIQEFSFVYRPEIMIMCLGLASYYFLQKYLSKKIPSTLIISAVLAGLCILTHLNGLIFVGAAGLLLLVRKHWKAAFSYGVISGAVSLFYFWDFIGNWGNLSNELLNNPSLGESYFQWYHVVINVLSEHMRFFHSEKELFFSTLFFIALILKWKYLKKKHPDLLYYCCFLALSLALISHGKTAKYLLYYTPFMALLIAIVTERVIQESGEKYWKKQLITVAVAAYIMVSFIFNARLSFDKVNLVADNKEVRQLLGSTEVQIAAPMSFIFGNLENSKIQSINCLEIITLTSGSQPNRDSIFRLAKHFKNDYLIFDEGFYKKYELDISKKNYNNYYFQAKVKGLYIYSLKK